LMFMERSAPFDAFVPFRNPGFMFFDTVEPLDERVSWSIGMFRTNARNTGNPTDLGDGEYAETGRLTFLPYYAEDGRYLVHFGASGSHRSFTKDKGNDQVRFRAFPEIRVGQYIFADTGSFRADSVDLAGAEFAFQVGPFAL